MLVFGNRREWLRPAAILLGILVLVFASRAGERRLRLASPETLDQLSSRVTVPTPALGESLAPKSPAAAGSARAPAATTANLLIYAGPGSYDAAASVALAEPLEAALAYVQERSGMRLIRPVNVVFDRRVDACAPDAVAYTAVRTLILYTCPDTPTRRAINILAHEFIHQLAHDHYGAPHLEADLMLSEGLATWGAGRYWLGRERDFRDFVATHYGADLLPLATDPRAGVPTGTLNRLYYQWAAYVEWIEATYGRAALDRLYSAGTGRRPGSAPYEEVLGISFAEAEARWRTWLRSSSPLPAQ